jgi:hypothetical protein
VTTEELIASQWSSLARALDRWWLAYPRESRYSEMRISLGRFMKWCALRGPFPELTSDQTIDDYVVATRSRWASKYHYALERRVRLAWNAAAFSVAGWPAVWVTTPAPRNSRPIRDGDRLLSFAETQFHPSLVSEVKRYCSNGGFLATRPDEPATSSYRDKLQSRLAWLQAQPTAHGAFVNEVPPLRRLAESTLRTQSRVVYKTATVLHVYGEADIQNLRRIVDVLTPQGAALLADEMETRLGRRGALAAAKYVTHFNSILWRCGAILPAAERQVVADLRWDLYGRDGEVRDISEKNYRRMAQFDEPGKFAMLVALPDAIMQEVERMRRARGVATEAEAREARCAIAIEILNTLPLRRQTLSLLDLERNFLKAPRAPARLVIFPDQEKSGKILEVMLSKRTWRLIELYRRHYRPRLKYANQSTSLFPGLRGHLNAETLGAAIIRVVKRRIGVTVNVHLWRHIMGSKLVEKTGRPKDGGRLLGHRPGSSASRRYIRLRSNEAAAKLGRVTNDVRTEGLALHQRQRVAERRRADQLATPKPRTT